MRRVLNAIHYPFYGGPQNQVAQLYRPLLDHGWESLALLPLEPGNAAARLQQAGVPVLRMPLHRLRARPDPALQARFIGGLAREINGIRRLIRSERIDLVQVNGLVNPHAAIAARLERVPVVWQILDTRPPMALRRLLMPLMTALADVIMTTGLTVAHAHPGATRLGNRLIPFYPPVDTAQFRPLRACDAEQGRLLPECEITVGTVANLTPQKGLEYFVDAADRVATRYPNVGCALIGRSMETHDRYVQAIQGRIASTTAALDGRFALIDPGDEVAPRMRRLDVFVLSSVPRSEGIPTTVLEAMASGVPVVATDVGGVREVVQPGVTGAIVPPLDVPALANAIERLVVNGQQRRRMSEQSRCQAVDRYDVKICADTHARAYAQAVEHAPSHRTSS